MTECNIQQSWYQDPGGKWFEEYRNPDGSLLLKQQIQPNSPTQTPASQVAINNGWCPLPNLQTSAIESGASFPFPLLVILAIAGITAFLNTASSHGRQQRLSRAQQAALLTLDSADQAEPASVPTPENLVTPGVLPGSGSEIEFSGTGGYGADFGVPNPWALTEEIRSDYLADKTQSELSTADIWQFLKGCTYAEFTQRISKGTLNPVPIVTDGNGKIAARDACFRWFSHGITQQNKVLWAVFGTDGKGAGGTAKAAVEVYKDLINEWQSVNVRG